MVNPKSNCNLTPEVKRASVAVAFHVTKIIFWLCSTVREIAISVLHGVNPWNATNESGTMPFVSQSHGAWPWSSTMRNIEKYCLYILEWTSLIGNRIICNKLIYELFGFRRELIDQSVLRTIAGRFESSNLLTHDQSTCFHWPRSFLDVRLVTINL